MCSEYWTLIADVTCPSCGTTERDAELQTHFMGQPGSCTNTYRLAEPVSELMGIAAADMDGLDRRVFIGRCSTCSARSDWGAAIIDGHVARIWPVRF